MRVRAAGLRSLPRVVSWWRLWGALLLAVLPIIAVGCGARATGGRAGQPDSQGSEVSAAGSRPVVVSGQAFALAPGQAFHFVDHFEGDTTYADLPVGGDGRRRILLGDARQPVLCAPAPYAIRQKVRLPRGAKLRTGFGLTRQSWNKVGAGVRFFVRLRTGDRTTELLSAELKRWGGADAAHWTPVTIDLPDAGGREVEIELATEMAGEPREGPPENFSHVYAVWLNPTLTAPPPKPRPNIVVVLVDALRPDHLGCYGYARETSPFLDGVADSGILFEDTTAQGTWTLPSTLSLLTSSYHLTRGARTGASAAEAKEGEDGLPYLQPAAMPASLQGELRKAGYTSLACVGGGFLSPALGWDSGFDWYWSPEHAPMLPDQLGAVKRRLEGERDTPFFLLLHTYEVHNYFQGWAHSLDHFDHGYLGPLTDPRRLVDAVLHGTPEQLSAADLQYVMDLYDGEIRHTDRYLQLFFDWLFEQTWGKNTLVVVIADHGEALGGHGAMSHGGVPYQDVACVPLLVRLPDGRWAGRRVTQPVALVDLMPSLLELAGAPLPDGIAGRSLVPLLQGDGRSSSRPILCESRGAALLARDGRWCYVGWRGEEEEELYDTARDPGQTRNLAAESPERLKTMRGVLAELTMRAAQGYRVVVAGPRPGPVTVELECDGAFSYLDVTTLQQADEFAVTAPGGRDPSGASRGHRARVSLSAGEDPHVILFERADADSTVLVSASIAGKAVDPTRIHLGRERRAPGSVPVSIGPASTVLLRADDPPVAATPGTWGIWIWLPTNAARAGAERTSAMQELPESMREQLRALGYLR